MKMYQEAQAQKSPGSMLGGLSAGAKSAISAGAPVTPVQSQLLRQRELLNELDGAAGSLIDPLRTALSHDPREVNPATGSGCAADPMPAPSCDLEAALMNANSQIVNAIDRLRQIRGAIRL